MSAGEKFAYWSTVMLAVVYALTAAFLLYAAVRVIKLVGKQDRLTPAMLLCLSAACFSKFLRTCANDLL